ncbi:MAG: lipase [Leptospira sp.]|nr:lipase [Leptospira sp.]
MSNRKFSIYLSIIFSFLLLQYNCRSLNPFAKDYNNYHSSRFECYDSEGWRDSDKFKRYLNLWTAMRYQYGQENSKVRNAKTVITGNSLVHLFTPELMEQELPSRNVINRGIGGDMTETLLLRLDDDVLSLNPSTVVIEIGGNDLIQGKCLSRIQNNVHSIVSKIRSRLPRARIIFISVPPTDVKNLNAIVPVYNQFLATLPNQYPNLIYVDTWNDMRDENLPTIRRDMLREGRDKIHFNEKGYSVWGKMLRPLL